MDWLECSERMDRYVIKKDGTAVDIEYFMATHVPFRDLEFFDFGFTGSGVVNQYTIHEEELYKKYILNKSSKHQMLIVRGSNGTGKSHLICWLYNRFVNDKNNYNPSKERVIFLRRLGNTIRGAMQQILDEGIVQDKELKDKIGKFVNADKSQSESQLKTTIYTEFAKLVYTDETKAYYRKPRCKEIYALLNDINVQEYMMRSGGPVDRCYQLITSGAKNIVTSKTEAVFDVKDFDFPRELNNNIKRNAAEIVRNYYFMDLKDDSNEIKKLVSYLNHFTSTVVQGCANISSENSRDLFVDLRKSLYKEGKNLTIFIEDFTSFSIVESELITALSVENGGKYNDLCRVTSVIGITDGYYESFKDNFKDRVTHQINVTEHSYSDETFIKEMAARYLNAIYCNVNTLKSWYQDNLGNESLPNADFMPSYEWDYCTIGDKKYTLYPFSINSILNLYKNLKHKTPRNFLTQVIQHYFLLFAEDKHYNNDWRFPELLQYSPELMLQPPHSNVVENTTESDIDKNRLKVLFKVWGNGTTNKIGDYIGGIRKEFLEEIGLGNFGGLVGSSPVSGTKKPVITQQPAPKHSSKSREEQDFSRRQEDLTSWLEANKTLEYAADFNGLVASFVSQAIPWQDLGVPSYIIENRLQKGEFVFIEDSRVIISQDNAIVTLERTEETRTILLGLLLFSYHKSWDFDDAIFYQFSLINWLERNKASFINRIIGQPTSNGELQVITWSITIDYLHRIIYGENVSNLNDIDLLERIIKTDIKKNSKKFLNKDWNDLIQFVDTQQSKIINYKNYLRIASKTSQGIVGKSISSSPEFYRTRELLSSIEHLKKVHWNIKEELDGCNQTSYEVILDHLKSLYSKIDKVSKSQRVLTKDIIKKFEGIVGDNPTRNLYIDIIKQIQDFYAYCNEAHETYSSDLKIKFDRDPMEQANEAIGLYENLKSAIDNKDGITLLMFSTQQYLERFNELIENFEKLEALAISVSANRQKVSKALVNVDKVLIDAALAKLEALDSSIAALEVKK